MEIRGTMQLLVDSDAFCKLGVCGLLTDAVAVLEIEADQWARLPALPHMLRRGSLVRRYGDENCALLAAIAAPALVAPSPSVEWLDRLVSTPDIDVGEAQLLALTAERGLLLMTGDKRALRAVASVPGFAERLSGRIVVLEAVLLALCRSKGTEAVRAAVRPIVAIDQSVKIAFSSGNPDCEAALWSYFDDLQRHVLPLQLWRPRTQE